MADLKIPKRGVIEAAGGLLWRSGEDGQELAVVHRPAYDDWSLPKGKLKSKETYQQAAVREVGEETLCAVRLGNYAGSLSYLVGDFPKIVLFWHMQLDKGGQFISGDEIDRLLWLTPEKAVARLSYQAERDLVGKER